ncbi:MAG TPA: carbohydrate-binding family 9-like protein [Thermoanaerobaculia bacterium]|nr:carbohydrate-binding family 9-like protein [Thermoanaerobaculia bacterium]
MTETLVVPRAPFDMEEPWSTPPNSSSVRLRRATDAAAPRLSTSIAAWYDDQCVSFLFSAADDYIHATLHERDAPLYDEDVVEIFITPNALTRYYEFEVSPHGAIFDAIIDSPHGVRETMHADKAWNCPGLVAAVRKIIESNGAMSIDTLIRIPFASLGTRVPDDGEQWRANFFRIDRHPGEGDEYTAWQPTMKNPPDFHVAAAFGILEFRK